MEKRFQAVYKDGVLQPLEPVPVEDQQRATVTITDADASNFFFTGCRFASTRAS